MNRFVHMSTRLFFLFVFDEVSVVIDYVLVLFTIVLALVIVIGRFVPVGHGVVVAGFSGTQSLFPDSLQIQITPLLASADTPPFALISSTPSRQSPIEIDTPPSPTDATVILDFVL